MTNINFRLFDVVVLIVGFAELFDDDEYSLDADESEDDESSVDVDKNEGGVSSSIIISSSDVILKIFCFV
jgi:hypothetical protein